MRLTLFPLFFLTAVTACGGSTVTDAPSPTSPVDTTSTVPTVKRSSIVLMVEFDPTDREIATRAGISMSTLQVVLQSLSRSAANVTTSVSSDGRARFDSLLEGKYSVSVQRALTATELARLGASEKWATLFAGGRDVIVNPPSVANTSISLVAPRRGSLVISELFPYSSGPPYFYGWGTYLEVYNNSDSTIHLDRMLLFNTRLQMHVDMWRGCLANSGLRADSTGVWVGLIQQFPGTGRDFPIAPGTAKVIAVDAMNHIAASPQTDQVDLSAANFEEFGNESDIDNPFVPNLNRIAGARDAIGRGYPFSGPTTYGLALPLGASRIDSTASLIRDSDGLALVTYKIPAALVLDLASFDYSPTTRASLAQTVVVPNNCDPWIGADRTPVPLLDVNTRIAIARKSLGRDAAGREVLQRTLSSARDFEYVQPLRRSLLR